jgi:hypothetical protein
MTAFDRAWALAKADFALRGTLSGDDLEIEQPDAYGYFFRNPVEYTYKPKGTDETQTITDQNYTLLGPIGNKTKLMAYRIARNSPRYDREAKTKLNQMLLEKIPYDANEPIVQYFEELQEQYATEEVINTTTHESGHDAHQRADPGYNSRLLAQSHNMDRRAEDISDKFSLFDYNDVLSRGKNNEASLKEYIAYMTQHPFDQADMFNALQNHPDVGSRYAARTKKSILAPFRKKRNLENAVLDIASRYLNRTNYDTAQFGRQSSASARKKIANKHKPVKDLLRQIRRLDEDEIGSFGDLPKAIQDGINNLKMRDAMTDFHEINFRTPLRGLGAGDIFDDNPKLFLDSHEMIDPSQYKNVNDGVGDAYLYDYDDYGELIENPDLVSFPPGFPFNSGERAEHLPDDFKNYIHDDYLFFKPKSKTNQLLRIPKEYRPKFGTDEVNRLIADAYRNTPRNLTDSSMAFTGR